MTEALGIFQPDIILRTAIVEAFRDLRAHPYLLDFVFSSLPNDPLTFKVYGQKEAEKAKQWFLNTDIPVLIVPKIDEAKIPCISIKLVSESEDIVTLGDVHYETTEDVDTTWPDLSTFFTPIGYDPKTGIVTLPPSVFEFVELSDNQFLIDGNGGEHQVLEVVSDNQLRIDPKANINLKGSVLKGPRPSWAMNLESVGYREVYQIGVHVSGEPVYLIWLHSILKFCLFRYKKSLLEGRGLERTTFTSSDFERNESISESELIFSRYMSLTGFVRYYWPKEISRKIVYVGNGSPGYGPVEAGIKIIEAGHLPDDVDVNKAPWIGDLDKLTGK